jgi:peroxiredoxin
LAIVGNGNQGFAQAFREDLEITVPILCDTDLKAYKAAGLRRNPMDSLSISLPFKALRAFRSGSRQGSVQGDPWQLGGVFVVEPNGNVLYRHVSTDPGDHAPVAEILAALDRAA